MFQVCVGLHGFCYKYGNSSSRLAELVNEFNVFTRRVLAVLDFANFSLNAGTESMLYGCRNHCTTRGLKPMPLDNWAITSDGTDRKTRVHE